MSFKNYLLEGSGLDFGGLEPRFWSLRASILEVPGLLVERKKRILGRSNFNAPKCDSCVLRVGPGTSKIEARRLQNRGPRLPKSSPEPFQTQFFDTSKLRSLKEGQHPNFAEAKIAIWIPIPLKPPGGGSPPPTHPLAVWPPCDGAFVFAGFWAFLAFVVPNMTSKAFENQARTLQKGGPRPPKSSPEASKTPFFKDI